MHLPHLEAFVRRRADHLALARDSLGDIVQSVCREALANLAKHPFEYRGRAQFVCWIHRIALTKLIGRRRRNARRELRADDVPTLGEISAELSTPSQILSGKEDRTALAAAFDELPPAYQQVIYLARLAELPTAQVAVELGRSEAATRKLLSRAMGRLALLLGERTGPDRTG